MLDIKIIAVYLFISSIAYRFLLFPKKLISLRGLQLFLILAYNLLLVLDYISINQITFGISIITYFIFLFYPQLEAKKILNIIITSDGKNEDEIIKRLKKLFILTVDFRAFKYEYGIIEYFLKTIAESTEKAKVPSSANNLNNNAIIKRSVPHITYILTLVIITMFLITNSSNHIDLQYNLIRYGGNFYELVSNGEYFRFFSSIFLHANWIHLLMNAFALFYLGMFIERIAITRSFYLSIFIIGGVLASMSSFFLAKQNSVGASGAIFALIGALFSIVWISKDEIGSELRKKILKDVVFIVVINIAIGLSIKNIDNYAHMGGLISGISLTYILYKIKNKFLFKIFDALAIIIVIYGSIFLYKNIKTSYPQNIKFTKNINVSNIEFKIPNAWIKTKIGSSSFYQDLFSSRFILEEIDINTYLNSKNINSKIINSESIDKKVIDFDNIVIKINKINVNLIKFKMIIDKKQNLINVKRFYFFKYKNKYFRASAIFLKESYNKYGDIMTRFLEFNLKDWLILYLNITINNTLWYFNNEIYNSIFNYNFTFC